MKTVLISDSTLRDGNHSMAQQIPFRESGDFLRSLDSSGVDWVEVGHGNGLGASSMNFGHAPVSDLEILEIAREHLSSAKLSVHVMPGIATYKNDVEPAVSIGVDIFRVAAHCTEADTTTRMIAEISKSGLTAVGVLMMAHRLSPSELAAQAKVMFVAGASAVMLMDSAGTLTPRGVSERIDAVLQLDLGQAGFHAHNNLGLALWNSVEAAAAGASILDSTVLGCGAGAGNCPTELLRATLQDFGMRSRLNDEVFNSAKYAKVLGLLPPQTSPLSILTGKYGIFSGFARQIRHASELNKVGEELICRELASYETVAGQEDLVYEIAERLSRDLPAPQGQDK